MTWWLQEGWTSAICPRCGNKIWPEGDPDWGLCFDCFEEELIKRKEEERLAREYERAMIEEREKNA